MAKVEVLATPEALATTPNPGTTVWVPMWNLAGGSSNAYKGDWAAGTYYPGDHVVYNGILYECVRQTTAAPVPWPPAPGAASYGTTLPASPVDGQEAILVDSVTNPTYQWRFRWNAGSSSAYKWEFVGGAPLVKTNWVGGITINTGTNVGGWYYLPASMSMVAPRAGDYQVNGTVRVTTSGAALGLCQFGYFQGTTLGGVQWADDRPAGGYASFALTPTLVNAVTAAQAFGICLTTGAPGTNKFDAISFAVQPLRVS